MTGLSNKICVHILEQMTKSKSLRSLNIGNNPGIIDSVSRILRIKLKVRKQKKEGILDLYVEKSSLPDQEKHYYLEGIQLGGIAK